jgi:anaerobic selenocysteine-containing dehydrogenase
VPEYNPPLRVLDLEATKRGDRERGPQVRLNSNEARIRQIQDGDYAWVIGPRRKEIATVRIDDSLQRGSVILRDVLGAAPSEIIRLTKIDTQSDTPRPT